MSDEKVISRSISDFDKVLPGKNKYLIIIPSKAYKCKYVHVTNSNVLYTIYGSKEMEEFVGEVCRYDNIIIHCLTKINTKFVISHPYNNYTWIVWGGDLYSGLLTSKGYQLYAYPKDVIKQRKKVFWKERYLYPLMSLYHRWLVHQREMCVSKIRNVCTGDCDYQLLLDYFKGRRIFERKHYFYYPIEEILSPDILNQSVTGNNIMVGNSASFTNNHREVFEYLSRLDLKNRKVVVPISYGANKDYVMECGNNLLKDSFYPMTEFLPLQEYNNILLNASTVIFGNYRQEAFGNIIPSLYLGATLFFSPKNPLFRDLRNQGYIVFSINDLNDKLHYKLSEKEVNTNRRLIKTNYSQEVLYKYIKDYFS